MQIPPLLPPKEDYTYEPREIDNTCCKYCGITSFAHIHRANVSIKDYELPIGCHCWESGSNSSKEFCVHGNKVLPRYRTPKDPNSNHQKHLKKFRELGPEGMYRERFIKRALSVGFTQEQAEFLFNGEVK